MAKVELASIAEGIHGKMDKNGHVVMRQKKYRAPSGKVMKRGPQEAFTRDPRDFNRTPAQGAELANMRSFGDISLMVSEMIRAGKLTEEELAAMNEEDRARAVGLRAELEEFRERFYAQFKKADPEAPFEKKLQPSASVLRRKQYSKIDTFIQAILRERIKNSQN
ncbi:MAG: hypothetical protein IJQ84_09715 [Paludibacteraceae bacterium]|nr:hypothetical protein [Paludibacteraceae bacterium]